jgi:hypothetical protein
VYRGLYNPSNGLDPSDFATIGNLNVSLMLQWNQWVHRRVDSVRFVDGGTIRREVSVDFTLPWWFHRVRGTPVDRPSRQLVPLGLLRKGTLVNFNLRNESETVLPLLTTSQNGVVAEASLVALAGLVLESDVPSAIQCDIRQLVTEPPGEARESLTRLFQRRDPANQARAALGRNQTFRSISTALANFRLALTMVDIACHQRRILYFSYHEALWSDRYRSLSKRAYQMVELATGRPRNFLLMVPTAGDADSFHFEAEAPKTLKIAAIAGYTSESRSPETAHKLAIDGSYDRCHVHFPQAKPNSQAAVIISLSPRPTTIVRGALAGSLTILATILLVAIRLDYIKGASAEGMAALLLAFPGLVAAYLSSGGSENPMATDLLWPIRLLAITPVMWSTIATGALVAGTTSPATHAVLWVDAGLAALSAVGLLAIWIRLIVEARDK